MSSIPSSFEVGQVAVEVLDGERTIAGRPWGKADGPELEATATIARVATPDGFVGFIALQRWPDGETDLRLTDSVGEAGEYGRLHQAGALAVKRDVGRLVAMLKALKYGPKGYAQLANVEWADLDGLAGRDARQLLTELGARSCADYGDLWDTSAQYRRRPGIEVSTEEPSALFAAFVLTRVVPLMRRYGKPGVEAVE
ncbi:MAG: hypothetical protein EAS51_00075 [Microbacteriaceae bacterium]|nr:MAG: hypothetical protein EAS51_00075 [Microbacteriaceae bacterium]